MIPRISRNTNGPIGTVTGFVGGVGRFGLRANGVEILQFAVGGLQGELSFTSLFNPAEINFPTLFPGGMNTTRRPRNHRTASAALSEQFGPARKPQQARGAPLRALQRYETLSATPLRRTSGTRCSMCSDARNPAKPLHGDSNAERRSSGGRSCSASTWWSSPSARSATKPSQPRAALKTMRSSTDRKLNCVGCHTPIRKTGLSPTALTASGVGSDNLSYKWAPIFSDLLLHRMPVIDAERETTNGLPRDVVVIPRLVVERHRAIDEDRGDDHWQRQE